MTVGQRIAQKRRELGLSQEALGERLGVSRQAIYKWESDAALPEIEKLVNLSREFSVSIDWLLGQEDEGREPQELTPEQLRMVEEIVGRYLAARPAQNTVILRETVEPEPAPDPEADSGTGAAGVRWLKRWGLSWVWLGAMVVIIIVICNLFERLDKLYRDTQNLQMNMAEVRYDVNNQIYGIANRVEEVLQSQNRLTAEQSAEVTATDYRANTVTVTARALPRTYVEGMTAEFILASGGENVTAPGVLGDDHAFMAELTGPLTDEITVSVVFLTGDQRETQLLDQFTYLYSESFPDVWVMDSLWGSGDKVDEYAHIRVTRENADRISSLRLGLFRDGKLLAWYEHLEEKPERYSGDWPDTEFFRLEGEYTLEPGHEYYQAAVVVDEYGRERVYTGGPPVVYDSEEGFANFVENTYESSYDPADWEY